MSSEHAQPSPSGQAIAIARLGKMYKLYRRPADKVLDAFGLGRLFFWRKNAWQEFWALRDLDLTVPHGQRLGIIGRNGAGKSTLLKVITGNVAPTEGQVQVAGRIQALLELGTGFHPEFTGRDNIRASLSYQGLPSSIVRQKEAEIIDFAELDEFIDQPVKTYSAGMYARLAFSTATAVEPEVLIIDEVLGAGDAYFAAKCVERMKSITEASGATVLFVSHDLGSVQQLCERVIWVDRGRIVMDGQPLEVTKAYYASIMAQEERRLRARNARLDRRQAGQLDEAEADERKLLFRLVTADGGAPRERHPVRRLTLLADGEPLAEVCPGAPMDNDAGDKAWLLTDPRFMLWREPETAAGRRFRCFADTGGSYLHAPFVFRVPKEALTSHKLSLEAEHGAVPGDQVRIEAFDGRGYHLVGVLEPGRGWRSQHWPLPQTITGRRPEHPEPAEASPGIRRGAGILPLPVGGPAPDPNLGVDEAAGPSQAEPAAAQQVESLVQQRGFDGVVEVVLRQRAVDRFYSDWAEFLAITLADGQGRAKVVFGPGESLQITVRAAVRMPLPVCELALAIYSMSNVVIATAAWPLPGGLTVGEHEWTMSIERPNLRQQEYLVSAALVREAPRATNERVQFYCRWNRSLSFRVEEGLVGNLPVGLVNLEMNPPSGAPLVPGRQAAAVVRDVRSAEPADTPEAFRDAVIRVLGEGPHRGRPGNLRQTSQHQIDDVLLREYTYINGFGEAVGLTIAEPPQRRFAEPVLAIHQTNDVGRRELFGLDGDPDLAFGLELARRGHRVLAHDLFMTGDRSERHWDKAAFYAAHPDWSMTGKMIADLQDLLEVMAAELGETGAVDVIGHSQGGVVAYFLAALEPRIRRAACNACYFGQPASGDPWDSQIYTSQTLNEARRGWCLGAHLDRLIALAARQRDLLLVCYRQDHILTDPLPQGRELENMKHWAANPHVRLLDGRHAFPEVVREAAYGFLETGRFSLAPAEART